MRRWLPSLALILALSVLVRAGESASGARAQDLEAGKALYARNCAVCHGETGRGDGPSAAGLPIKPSDLTDGRLMNPLPDGFLVNIILRGGAAEGLAPAMPPFAQHLGDQEVRRVVAYVRSLAEPPFDPSAARPLVEVPGAPRQPILFSHVIHAGSFGIDCQHCHAGARRASAAGLPSVERCMGCHTIIGADGNPEIAKLHDYWRRGEPIAWVRVFKLPEFTYFPHKAHVRAGVACQACHGPVERMRVVGADTGPRLTNDLTSLIGLRPPPPPFSMGWCLECHRRENATRGTQAPLDCFTCHH